MRSDDGYTLLELVVAVAIIALMSAPLAMGVEFGVRSWRAINTDITDQERVFLVRQRLRSWFEAAYPFDMTRRVLPQLLPFEGQQSQVIFVSPIHPDPRLDALFRVTLRLDNEELQVGFVSDHASYDFPEPDTWHTLLKGVDTFGISYLNEVDPDNPIWVATWESVNETTLPSAVRIKLSFLEENRIWQDLVVPLENTQWSHCNLGSSTDKCERKADS